MASSAKSSPRRRTICFTIAVLTMIAGIVTRKAPLGLPYWFVKYGAAAIWAMMVYWVAATLRPSWEVSRLAVDAALIAALIEFFKLYHAPALDAFRRTLVGGLLLGRYFSWMDIAVYCLGIAIVASLDFSLVRRGRS